MTWGKLTCVSWFIYIDLRCGRAERPVSPGAPGGLLRGEPAPHGARGDVVGLVLLHLEQLVLQLSDHRQVRVSREVTVWPFNCLLHDHLWYKISYVLINALQGDPSGSSPTSCWHQKECCISVYANYTKTQLLSWCHQKIGNYLMGHPV